MTQKPFSLIHVHAVTLTSDPKINRVHPRLKGSLCITGKFHEDVCKGNKVILNIE